MRTCARHETPPLIGGSIQMLTWRILLESSGNESSNVSQFQDNRYEFFTTYVGFLGTVLGTTRQWRATIQQIRR